MDEARHDRTRPLRLSTCRYCHCCIGLTHWSGWVDLSPGGSHDMCPATLSGVHEPSRGLTSVDRP